MGEMIEQGAKKKKMKKRNFKDSKGEFDEKSIVLITNAFFCLSC